MDLEEKVLENYEIPNLKKIHFDLENPNEVLLRSTIIKFSRKVMVKTLFNIVNR